MRFSPSKVIYETQYNRVWYCAYSCELTFETWQPDPAGKGFWVESPTVKLIDVVHAVQALGLSNIHFPTSFSTKYAPSFEQQVLDAG